MFADQLRRVLLRFQLRHQLPWNYSMRPRRELLKFVRSVSSCFALSCKVFSTLSSSLLVFASFVFCCCRDFIEKLEVVAADVVDIRLSLHRCQVWSCHSLPRQRHAILMRSGSRLRVKLHCLVCIPFDSDPFLGPFPATPMEDVVHVLRALGLLPNVLRVISAHLSCAFGEE